MRSWYVPAALSPPSLPKGPVDDAKSRAQSRSGSHRPCMTIVFIGANYGIRCLRAGTLGDVVVLHYAERGQSSHKLPIILMISFCLQNTYTKYTKISTIREFPALQYMCVAAF